MTLCSELAEFAWLTGSEARAYLDELAVSAEPLHRSVQRLRGRLSPSQAHLLLEQIELRRRAAAKFTHAAQMFFTRIGLEQATDEWVARYKASRFAQLQTGSAPRLRVADLCCGIGGDLEALARNGTAIGVDLDPIASRFAQINTGAVVRTLDATNFDFKDVDAWHIDPDRRPNGRRTTGLASCQPPGDLIDRLLARSPHAAVKLAPAAKPPDEWIRRCELEWISRDRECRQLVAWHGELAHSPGLHRATVVAAYRFENSAQRASRDAVSAVRTIVGEPRRRVSLVERLDRFVFDVDPAVTAARLSGVLAAQHELGALATGPTYLTGPHAIDDAALACFEVEDVLPLRVRLLAQYFRNRGIGQLEIKKRGVDIDPDQLRRQFKLRGVNSGTLLITPMAGRPTAILARRVSP